MLPDQSEPVAHPSSPDDRPPVFACTLVGSAAQFEDLRATLRSARAQLAGLPAGPDQERIVGALNRFLVQLGALQRVTVSEV